MGRRVQHVFPDGELNLEYRPGGTVDVIATDDCYQIIELNGIPWETFVDMFVTLSKHYFRDRDKENEDLDSLGGPVGGVRVREADADADPAADEGRA